MVPRVKDYIFIFIFFCLGTMKQIVYMDRKGTTDFIFFKSSKHGIIVLHALRYYLRNMWNPAK